MITHVQLGLFVTQADLALLGADSLLPDGSYLLALAAQDRGVPLYVCCESFKRRKEGMGKSELEEMEARELGAPSLPGVMARNIYFDTTPARLISRRIDETGVHATGIF